MEYAFAFIINQIALLLNYQSINSQIFVNRNLPNQMKNSKKSKKNQPELRKSFSHSLNRPTFPFHAIKFCKAMKNEERKNIERRSSTPIAGKRNSSNSVSKNSHCASDKKLSYCNNTFSTNFSISAKKSQFLKKEANKEKQQLKIKRNLSKELISMGVQSKDSIYKIQKKFISPIQSKEQVVANLEIMRKYLDKPKKNRVYGPLITQAAEKYEDIIEFMMKQNLKLLKPSTKNNTYCIQKQNKILKKQFLNGEKKNILGLNLADIKNKNILDYQDQFLSKADQFSQSWTDLMQRQNRY